MDDNDAYHTLSASISVCGGHWAILYRDVWFMMLREHVRNMNILVTGRDAAGDYMTNGDIYRSTFGLDGSNNLMMQVLKRFETVHKKPCESDGNE